MKRLMLTLFAVVFGFATADAQITQGRIGNGDITIYGTEWNDVYGLDIDNDGILEIRISDFESTPTIYNGAFSYDYEDNGTNILADENMWDYVAVLDAGVTVGAGNSSLFAGYGDAYFDGSNISVGTHYLAFRIKLDDGLHYAWAEYTMTEESGNYRATFNACYYNATVGADIVTGDTGSDSCMMTAPFSENFDALTSGIPDCWTQEASNSARAEWTYDATGHSGSCLSFGDWDGENSRLIFPAVDCSALTGGAQLSLCYKNPAISNGNKATLALYYRISDSGEWIAVDGFSITTATEEWTCVEILLPNSTAAPYYQLSLVATGYNTYPRVYAYIDDIVVGAPSACPRPSDFAAIPTDNSLTLSWTENGSATAWQLKVGDDEWLDVTDNPYTLDHLTANTSYTVQVRSNCGGGDLSLPVSVSTRTLCSTQTIPYNEPFTGHETGVAPACWTTVVASDTYPKVVNTASYATDGNYLELFGSYSSHVSFIASPILESNANTLYLSFDAWLSNYSSDTLYVGVMDNPADASTFTSVFSLVGNQNGGSWTNYEINLSAESAIATSTAKYIAFRFYGSSDYGRIDNIVVSEPPACAKPVNLTLDGATDTSLTLSWIEAGSATKWVVKVGDGAWTETTDNPYTIDGLAANTEYTVTVRAFCDPDTSDAVSGSFRTLCGAETFPYEEDFESYTAGSSSFPECWTSISGTNYVQANGYSTYASQGVNALHMQGPGSVASPVINIAGNDVFISFDMKREGDNSGDMAIGVAESPAMIGSAVWIDTITAATTYNRYEYTFRNTSNLASGCIVFKQVNTTYSNYFYWIDSLTVAEPPACAKPVSLTLDEATDTSLTLSWTENGSATKWVVKVGDGAWTETTDNPYTIDGLAANTEYAVTVRAFCDPDTSDAVSGSFRTLCGAETFPYEEDFESYTAGSSSFPECWTSISGTNYVQANGYSTYASQGVNALHMQGPGSVASPVINIAGNDVFISFDLKREDASSGDMAIGVAVSPAMVESALWIDTITAATTYNRYEYTFRNTSNLASGCIVFKQVNTTYSNYFYWIDSLTVAEPPACAKPVNLTLDGATDTSLTLSWTENGSATKWVVKVGDGAWTETTDNPYTIDGLAANTEYAVTVRAFCDPDTSDAVSGSFRTACAAQSVPYSENFDAMTTNAAPSCWTVALAYSNYSGSYPYVATSAANGGSGNGLYFNASSSNSNIIATPMLDRNANGCLVAFDARLANYSVVNLHVGVMSDPSDASTFEGVYTINGSDNAATWQPYEIDLSTFNAIASSDAKYIAFKFDGNYDYGYLDNLSVSVPLPCKKPTDLAALPSANSLELSWTGNGTANQWLVKVDDGDYQLTSDNPYTVTGLAPSSTYTVEVRAYCGEGDTSYAVVGTFNTDCAIASVPYNEDFEGITSGLPNCWQQDATNETRSKWNFTADGREGNAVFFEDFWAESSRLIVVPVDCSTLTTDGVIRFAYKRTLGSSDTYVTATAYYRTAADGEWTAIDGWSLSETMDEWNDVELTLPASANAPYYQVSILATGEDTYTPKPGLYIDNLYIGPAFDTPEPPTCDIPTGLTVSDITASSATVSWTDVELPAADEGFIGDWTLNMDENAQIHRTLTLDPSLHSALSGFGNDIPDADEDASVAGNEMTMSITAASGDQVNVTGTFSLEVTDGVTLPFNYSTTGTVTASGLNIEPADLTQSATLYNIMPVNFTGTLTFAQPTAMPDNGTLTVGIASIDIDGAGSVSMGFVSGNATMSITGNGITAAGSKDAADANQATYELVLVNTATDAETNITTSDNPYSFENLTAETDYTVKIRTLCAENNTSDWSDAVPFTTLGEEPASCDVPTALDITNVTASSAVISWTGDAEQYELEINGQTTTVASAPYIAQGLSAETDYSVRVRAICDNDIASDWTSIVTFTTLDNGGQEPESCATPVNVTVSSVTTNSAVVTWQAGLANESFIGDWALNMSETDSVHMVITPDQGMHTLLQFVGYDIEDVDENVSIAGTVVPVSIEPATGDQVNVTGSFDMNMYGVDEPVTFNFATTGTLSNNTLTIEPASINETVRIMDAMPIDYTGSVVFVQPTALPVDGNLTLGIASLDINGYGDTTVSMGGYTMSGSVTISMTGSQLRATGPRSSESVDDQAYELVLTNTTTAVETNVSPASSPYTAQNLAPSTTYTVKVRALCDGGNTSEWSAPVSFTTLDENPQPEPCDAPSGVSVVNVTATTATVSWTGSASAYQIEVFASGQPITASASASPYTITGLSASTGYTVHVRAICDGGLTSDWSDAVSFTTLDDGQQTEPCDVPANLTITNVTATSFTASWSGTTGHYEVDFLQTLVEVAENTYSMQFLTPSTTYTIRVRALCDNGGVSEWSDVVSFTTLPEGGTQGIADVEAASGSICIYPNPASNQTTVSIDGFNGSATLNVIDMSGRTVVSAALTEGSAKLDVSHLAAGTYFVRVQGENLSAIRKLVVK